MSSNGSNKSVTTTRNEFGTFAGVFVPSILTILGIIMFTRTGFVVGVAGVKGALAILVVCEVIVLLSALSISAIATNTPVRGGGAYFLISRVLGAEFGGSIGLALYFAQALSVPFYILGFTEALVSTWPAMIPYFSVIAVVVATILFVVTYIGASWAIRAQYIVLAILALAIISFLGGAWLRFDSALLESNWEPAYLHGHTFWSVLAIYFPAVTGIMAGVNMSGDLKNPQRSLVRGTFAAIVVGFIIYAAEILLCGASQSRIDLVERPYEMLMRNALMGTAFLVAAGVFAATTSSALGSFLGAPRVMQALSRDRIFRFLRPFSVGSKKGDEPRRALGITFIITLLTLWFSSGKEGADAFNFVAVIVTMFFLCTYGIVNLAAFVESFGSNPSFRPRFKYFHWSTAFLGAAGCGVVMLLIDVRAAIVSVAVITGLYIYVSRWVVTVAFGDARRGFVHAAVTKQLLRLRYLKPHAKNWRPTILVLSGNPETRLTLMKYGLWLEAGRGIVSVTQLLSGDLGEIADRRDAALERLNTFIRTNNLNVFPEVVVSRTFDEGIRVLLQAHSIGPIKPNMVLMVGPRSRHAWFHLLGT